MTFSEILRKYLRERNITEKALSKKSGISTATLTNYLHGRSKPTVASIGKLANALECDYEELYNVVFK